MRSFLTIAGLGVMIVCQTYAQTPAESQTPSSGPPSADSEFHSLEANQKRSSILITIDKTDQKMTVAVDGIEQYEWPVSTGRFGYSTPSGVYTASSMNAIWYSKEWDNAPMPHSIFFMKDGHAIHGTNDVKSLGEPVSHGCVRISPQNAATLYALVEQNGLENTQVVLNGVTPGGESTLEAGGLGWFDDGLPTGRGIFRFGP
jgi:lipoprotein-anchoring transpeptidase ErfK/SrfK